MNMPMRLGPYELLARLGSGGMAETHLAVRRGPGGFEQRICLKRILSAHEGDPAFVRRFMEEARLGAQLRHANITQVIDFGQVSGVPYLALELVDGMDLRQLLHGLRSEGRQLSVELTIFLGLELAHALAFAHGGEEGRPSVIHRDISPSNILLSRSGTVYLTDFGIACAMGSKGLTVSGVTRGKLAYMAPEYALDGTFSQKSDLFSLGVVLFEALTGMRPYEGTNEPDTLRRLQTGRALSLESLRPGLPQRLVALLGSMIAADSRHRPADARAVFSELAHLAAPPTVRQELTAWVQRYAQTPTPNSERPGGWKTETLDLGLARPVYPEVRTAGPDAETRTRTRSSSIPGPRIGSGSDWSATDPERISHHAEPLSGTSGLGAVPSPSQAERAQHAAGDPKYSALRRGCLLALSVLLVISAAAAAYLLVHYLGVNWRHG